MAEEREMDIRIAELMGYSVEWSRDKKREPLIPELGFLPCPKYSTRIGDAWKVADFLWQKHCVSTSVTRGLVSKVTLSRAGIAPVESFEKAAPKAICMAAACFLGMQ